MDEARVGLQSDTGRRLTDRGVKPVAEFLQAFECEYILTAIAPFKGREFSLRASGLDTEVFAHFLDLLCSQRPQEIHFILLDRAGWHCAKRLKIPKNCILWLLPPYSPELNPVERFWQEMRRTLKNLAFKTLDELWDRLHNFWDALSPEFLSSLCAYPYLAKAREALLNTA